VSDALGWAIFGGILVALALVFLVLLRERRAAERRFEKMMEELTSRLDGMLEELRSAADRTTDDERRGRILGELGGTIDLDEVLTRVLEAAGAIRGVDAALVLLPGLSARSRSWRPWGCRRRKPSSRPWRGRRTDGRLGR
jgi:hypothetical protein